MKKFNIIKIVLVKKEKKNYNKKLKNNNLYI